MEGNLYIHLSTGKSLLEALILRSTNPQYDKRFFIDLPVQYMKIPGSNLGEHVVYRNCFWYSEQLLYKTCSAKRRASDKDLPAHLGKVNYKSL